MTRSCRRWPVTLADAIAVLSAATTQFPYLKTGSDAAAKKPRTGSQPEGPWRRRSAGRLRGAQLVKNVERPCQQRRDQTCPEQPLVRGPPGVVGKCRLKAPEYVRADGIGGALCPLRHVGGTGEQAAGAQRRPGEQQRAGQRAAAGGDFERAHVAWRARAPRCTRALTRAGEGRFFATVGCSTTLRLSAWDSCVRVV